ncbi:ATP-dependent RecD-like DNA helicase [Calditerricola yamamurae]
MRRDAEQMALFGGGFLKGEIVHEIFHNDETLYTVARIKVLEASEEGAPDEAVVVGHFPRPHPDEQYVFYGEWVDHPKFGRQYHARRFEKAVPKTRAGLIKYLSSGLFPGVGKKTAEKIVDRFGEQALTIIAQTPERLEEIPGLSTAKARKIHEAVLEHQALEQALVFLYEFGIGTALALRIYQVYRHDTLRVLREDPYRLIVDVEGVGFKRADEIGRAVGVAVDSPRRVRAACLHLLQEAAHGGGHVFLPVPELVGRAVRLLDESGDHRFADADVEREILALHEEGQVVVEGSSCYLPSLYWAEVGVARHVARLLATPAVERFSDDEVRTALAAVEDEMGLRYAPSQRLAIETAVREPLMILTGGPGTGKTTVLRGLCRLFARLWNLPLDPAAYRAPGSPPYPILLVAPTGRAAKRMGEATGLPAMTVHRLLGWRGDAVERDADNPLEGKLLIVDETSMMDIWLTNQLLRAVPRGMRVLFVGDADQLPSVGPGNVLADLIASQRVPVVRLTDVYRQAEGSSIIRLAHAVKDGALPDDFAAPFPDRRFFPCSGETCVDVIKQVCLAALGKGYTARDIQVLAPMYRGPAGVDQLNRELQALFNPPAPDKRELEWGETVFRVGDKVLQLVNNPEEQVFNGDIGEVAAILSPEETGEREAVLVVRFDAHEVRYRRSQLHQLTLAYCCSIHKAQGSEFPIVILPLLRAHWRMLRRNLLYTGITRAKSYLILCGEQAAFAHAARCADDRERFTALLERLAHAVDGVPDEGEDEAAPDGQTNG